MAVSAGREDGRGQGRSAERQSKSQRKRDAEALQTVAESLLELSDAELAGVPMPERLREAIEETRRMRSRGALRRQRRYLGRIMREIDAGPVRAALAELEQRARTQKQRFAEVEAWRDRLIAEGDAALGELLERAPAADRQHFRRLIRDARAEQEQGRPPRAARALFRALRELLDTAARP